MKILSARMHGYLDYLTAAGFAVAPSILGLEGLPKMICYALAGVHLLLTLLTDFPLGAGRILPYFVHGVLEFVVSVTLVSLPWMLGFSANPSARKFFPAAGAAVFLVWLVTDYRQPR